MSANSKVSVVANSQDLDLYRQNCQKLSFLPNLFFLLLLSISLAFLVWLFKPISEGQVSVLAMQELIYQEVQMELSENSTIQLMATNNAIASQEQFIQNSENLEMLTGSFDLQRFTDKTYYLTQGCQDLNKQENQCQLWSLDNFTNQIKLIKDFKQSNTGEYVTFGTLKFAKKQEPEEGLNLIVTYTPNQQIRLIRLNKNYELAEMRLIKPNEKDYSLYQK